MTCADIINRRHLNRISCRSEILIIKIAIQYIFFQQVWSLGPKIDNRLLGAWDPLPMKDCGLNFGYSCGLIISPAGLHHELFCGTTDEKTQADRRWEKGALGRSRFGSHGII